MSVLVVGGSGRLGRHTVTALADRGAEVAVLVRDPDRPPPPGGPPEHPLVRRVGGDLRQPDTVVKAAQGCATVLILGPYPVDQVDLHGAAVDAAADVGAGVVLLSSWGPVVGADSPVPRARRHWITQQYVLRRQLPYTFLQPNLLTQDLVDWCAGDVLLAPAGARGISLLDVRDLAEAAATVAVSPGHDKQTYVLTGPTAPTGQRLASVLSGLTGRDVAARVVPDEEFRQRAAARGRRPSEIDHVAGLFHQFRQGAGELVTADLRRITGREPRTAEDSLAESISPR